MAKKVNAEGRVPSKYPSKFNARENRLISANYAAVQLDVDGESYTLEPDDGITHVDALSLNCSLEFPDVNVSEGRVVKVCVTQTANFLNTIESPLPRGVYEFMCGDFGNGLEWKTVSRFYSVP